MRNCLQHPFIKEFSDIVNKGQTFCRQVKLLALPARQAGKNFSGQVKFLSLPARRAGKNKWLFYALE